ncbi:MAG TPA: signal peptide peptidase SppA [Xanthomonadaceae bacterium]|nr:signal peptide peptidase SppA [Xanthomonadaceae bacterium]
MAKQHGPVRRFFSGLWRAINTTRVVILNIVFFLLLFLFLGLMADKPAPKLEARTTLVLNPAGMIVEQSTADPTSRALAKMLGDEIPEIQLRDLVRAIDAAAADPKIERMLIRPDQVVAGISTLREVATALERFRDSGKEIVAYAEGMGQGQYYLAAQAGEVWLHPYGGTLLEGFSRYRQYYREALEDKLLIDVHLFRAGEFKSFGEPYSRDSRSEEAREADLYWMNGVWQQFLAEIAVARGLTTQTLSADIDALPQRIAAADGDLARMALDIRLVDALKTADEVRAELIERGVADDDGETFRQISLSRYLDVVDARKKRADHRDQVAIVVAMGGIMGGDQPPGTVGGESTSRLLRQARYDDEVKAVVLRVNSPGGGVFPSEQIRREVELLRRAGKPVVASMGDVAASGGYWISMDADRIFAHPTTITGSIGVIGLFFTVPRTLEHIGVRTDGVGTTRYAGAFDPTRPFDPGIGELIQTIIDKAYRDFLGGVARGRDSTPDAIDAVARGRVWSGAQAVERGLVDQLGGLEDAIVAAAELAKLDDYQVTYVEKEPTAFEKFLSSMGGSAVAGFVAERGWLNGVGARLVGSRVLGRMEADLRYLEIARDKPLAPHAHCFCGLD